MSKISAVEFPMAEAKKIVQDLFEPKYLIYWADFLFYDLLGWTALVMAARCPLLSLTQLVSFLVAALSLYRAVIFVHELTHLKKGTFQVFHTVWNLLCGFPLMVPSMLYTGVHIDHHKQRLYGTKDDHEYFDFALEKPYRILSFLGTMMLAPAVFLARFLIFTPASYIIQPLRKPLWEMASSLAVGGGYKRPLPDEREKRIWWVQEFMTFAYAAAGIALMTAGILSWKVLGFWYATAAFILFTNGLRTLVAHCYKNPPTHEMTFSEQFLDSIDIPGNPILTPLWAPVGLRFHATHHLFPGMPYHNLGKAQKRLLNELPKDSPYLLATRGSFWSAFTQLLKEATVNNSQEDGTKRRGLPLKGNE